MKKLLFPFAWLYALILWVRNFLFDKQILRSQKFPVKTVGIGNLALGGTGKSVVVEYLLDHFKTDHSFAVLSRGYKRKTKGFVRADALATALSIGDEPFQFYKNHPQVQVAVCERRAVGISTLMASQNPPEIVLLDDVMQHRWVSIELLIVTTAFDNLYIEDDLVPVGNLRDSSKQAKRAQIILVTKCPKGLTQNTAVQIRKKLNTNDDQKVFFTNIKYSSKCLGKGGAKSLNEILQHSFLLITGIANPKPLVAFLTAKGGTFDWLSFPDHHTFSSRDIKKISQQKSKIILTTEKDYGRLLPLLPTANIYYIPIQMAFVFKDEETSFKKMLQAYFKT